jgi:hypothetical protein
MVAAGRFTGIFMRILSFGLAATAAILVSCNAIAASAWHVETLPQNAPLLQASGCMSSFGPKGPHSDQTVFLDDGVDTGAKANIQLGGKLFALGLVSAKTSGKQGAESSGIGAHYDRVFKDKAGAVSVAASLVVTAEHPDADSTEMAGTLSVTYQGTTQKIAIQGGIAC